MSFFCSAWTNKQCHRGSVARCLSLFFFFQDYGFKIVKLGSSWSKYKTIYNPAKHGSFKNNTHGLHDSTDNTHNNTNWSDLPSSTTVSFVDAFEFGRQWNFWLHCDRSRWVFLVNLSIWILKKRISVNLLTKLLPGECRNREIWYTVWSCR